MPQPFFGTVAFAWLQEKKKMKILKHVMNNFSFRTTWNWWVWLKWADCLFGLNKDCVSSRFIKWKAMLQSLVLCQLYKVAWSCWNIVGGCFSTADFCLLTVFRFEELFKITLFCTQVHFFSHSLNWE